MSPPTTNVVATIANNATPTFGFFVTGSANVADQPAVNRVFARFTDAAARYAARPRWRCAPRLRVLRPPAPSNWQIGETPLSRGRRPRRPLSLDCRTLSKRSAQLIRGRLLVTIPLQRDANLAVSSNDLNSRQVFLRDRNHGSSRFKASYIPRPEGFSPDLVQPLRANPVQRDEVRIYREYGVTMPIGTFRRRNAAINISPTYYVGDPGALAAAARSTRRRLRREHAAAFSFRRARASSRMSVPRGMVPKPEIPTGGARVCL
jgi:hypothetical protein